MGPLTLADVLDGMFRLFLSHWRTYAIALGIVLVPQSFVMALLAGSLGMNMGILEQLNNPAATEAALQRGPELAPLIALIVISVLAALFLSPYLTGAACRIAGEAYEGRDPQPGEVARFTLRRYWSLIGVIFLQGLLFLLIFALPIGVIAAGVLGDNGGMAAAGGVLALFLFPVAIWLGVRWSLSVPTIVMEGNRPVAALRRSASLVEGRWWRVFGTLALAQFITAIVAQIAGFPFSLPGNLFSGTVATVLVAVGTTLTAIVTTPLAANAQTLLYYDGRVRTEGYDLEVMARDSFEAPPLFEPPPPHQSPPPHQPPPPPAPGEGSAFG